MSGAGAHARPYEDARPERYPDDVDDRVEVHDPWTLLGAIAVETTTIRIGTMVTP